MSTKEESSNSTFLEKLREYVFLSEILQEAWVRRHQTVDILRAEVDSSGYDLVLECAGIRRYIQLKSSRADAKTSRQTVNVKLAEKAGGCIIWLFDSDSDDSVKLEYGFFGGEPGKRLELGAKVGKHTKSTAQGVKTERPNTRVVNKGQFDKPVPVSKLFDKLFPGYQSSGTLTPQTVTHAVD